MPVYKYKTFEEAQQALWNFHPDKAYFKQLAELWDTASKLCPVSCPKGVFKYRNIDEANRQRQQWEIEYAKSLLSKRCFYT